MAPTDETLEKLARVNRIARFMDSAFRIPGTRWRIGADTLLGLAPGIGDTLALLPGVYIVATAWQLGASKSTIAQMTVNVGLDWAIGSIPIIGDIFDAGFKANRRNARLLADAVEAPEAYRIGVLPE